MGKGGVSPPAPPGTQAEAIVNRVEVVVQTENLVRKAILEDMPPKEAYLQYRKFEGAGLLVRPELCSGSKV